MDVDGNSEAPNNLLEPGVYKKLLMDVLQQQVDSGTRPPNYCIIINLT